MNESEERIQRRVWVSGRVQGVGFRKASFREASRYTGLKGYVRNTEDGRVELLVQGGAGAVFGLLAWCRKGPPSAQVEEVVVCEEKIDESLTSFMILNASDV